MAWLKLKINNLFTLNHLRAKPENLENFEK